MDIRKTILGVILLGLSVSAVAEDAPNFYAGTGAGIYYVDFDNIDFDESAATVRVFGGYQLNEYVSFEAGFTNLFESSGSLAGADIDIDGTAWDVSVRPTLPIGDNLQAFGILGWTQYDFEIAASFGGLTASSDDSESALLYGLGAALDLNASWNLRGEWVAIDVDDADLGMLSVSATYTFK
jgi:opacity protein-like surface antigen